MITRVKAAVLPRWLSKALITALLGAVITGAVAWASQLSGKQVTHESRISVLEDHQRGIDKSLDELKVGQQEQREDVKEILRRLPRRR